MSEKRGKWWERGKRGATDVASLAPSPSPSFPVYYDYIPKTSQSFCKLLFPYDLYSMLILDDKIRNLRVLPPHTLRRDVLM